MLSSTSAMHELYANALYRATITACVGPRTRPIVQAMNTKRLMLALLTYEENA